MLVNSLKGHGCWFVSAWLISFTWYYRLFVYRWTWHRYCKIWMKRQRYRTVSDGNISFISFILERLHLVNKIGQQVYLWRGQQEGGTPSHHHYLVTWLWQILISQILMHSDVQMNRYFSEPCDPTVMTLLAPGKEFSFVTTVKKKIKIYVSLFSGKEFLIYKFKLLSLLLA